MTAKLTAPLSTSFMCRSMYMSGPVNELMYGSRNLETDRHIDRHRQADRHDRQADRAALHQLHVPFNVHVRAGQRAYVEQQKP